MLLWLPLLVACASPDTCVRERGGRPASIAEAVDLINRLPAPVTVACVMESLERPLYVETTLDRFSAQPALGDDAPRIFVRNGPLTMSIVGRGDGRPLLEFGETVDDISSVKAELVMPIETPISHEAPYDRVARGDTTSCGLCHAGEYTLPDGRLASRALAPGDHTIGDIDTFTELATACHPDGDDWCKVMSSVFAHGEVIHDPFPETFATFYDEDEP